MIILGIDPGTQRVGYGIIEIKNKKPIFKKCGILKINKKNIELLKEVKKEINKLISKWKPKILGIEKLYFSKNQKTAMAVAEVRGVILLTALEKNIKILEYSPNEIKLSITGYGFADKKSVAKMVNLILKINNKKLIDDATDAIAISLVAAQNLNAN
ncbi:MAG: crossover junction endodeoxyribonuclease RuvC [Patescibacteria group bacterium]|nr:crossover junction endodeoxyribonuclease RuvC [Patescibacteria group bacterium]